jgi:hypothetical protein
MTGFESHSLTTRLGTPEPPGRFCRRPFSFTTLIGELQQALGSYLRNGDFAQWNVAAKRANGIPRPWRFRGSNSPVLLFRARMLFWGSALASDKMCHFVDNE